MRPAKTLDIPSIIIMIYNRNNKDEGETAMTITVKKPTEAEQQTMQSKPIWSCGMSEFDW